MTPAEILKLKFRCSDLGNKTITVKSYFKALLRALWSEGESFSGKRPFGNSGWQWDLYKVFIEYKLIPGTVEDGYIESVDEQAASDLVDQLIRKL